MLTFGYAQKIEGIDDDAPNVWKKVEGTELTRDDIQKYFGGYCIGVYGGCITKEGWRIPIHGLREYIVQIQSKSRGTSWMDILMPSVELTVKLIENAGYGKVVRVIDVTDCPNENF